MRDKEYKGIDNQKVKVFMPLILILLALLFLSGCSSQKTDSIPEVVPKEQALSQEQQTSVANESSAEAVEVKTDDSSIAPIPLYPGIHRSSILQEDENYLYLCGSCRIARVDKATGVQEILWENPEEVSQKGAYLYLTGSGLLIGDKIYFIERWQEDNWSTGRALSCVTTDGSAYEQLAKLKESQYDSLLLMDGTLMIDDLDREVFYQVFEDGTLSAQDENSINNQQVMSYVAAGDRALFRQESLKELGFVLGRKEGIHVAKLNAETEEWTTIPELEGMEAFNSQYFMCIKYDNGRQLVLFEKAAIREKYQNEEAAATVSSTQTREQIQGREIFTHDSIYQVLGMDEEYAYVMYHIYEGNSDSDIRVCYMRISLETGEAIEIFTQDFTDVCYEPGRRLMDAVIRDGYLYYMAEKDYKYYLMRRRTDGSGEAELVLGEEIYNTGIGEIGTTQTYQKEIYSELKPELLLYNIDLSWPVVDDSYPGANLINTYVIEHQNTNIAIAEQRAAGMEQWVAEDNFGAMNYDITSSFSGFAYFDSCYISYVLSEYEYQGGAHGMPYWVGFTFDLETGEKLLILDIINNSEEELKEIVSGYFAEMIQQEPENFWENAIDIVYETTDCESNFYLTEGGIVFYYGPYDLACYAAGFQQVTIPYDAFDMAISLEKAIE